jgi:hypothetical protein
LNIFNAINWTAEAWNNVTDDVIYRCWQRTGIIPEEYRTEGMLIETEENNETAVQFLLNRMDIMDLTARDYIDVDSTLEATQIIDDDEIIKAIQETTENEEAEEDNCPLVSDKIALESIHNLLNYIQQSNSLSVNSSVLSGMKDLQRQIRKKQVDSLKQASLQDYFTITM